MTEKKKAKPKAKRVTSRERTGTICEKKRKFAQLYAKGKKPGEAYVEAFPGCHESPTNRSKMAQKLLQDPRVVEYVRKLGAAALKSDTRKYIVSVDILTGMLLEDRESARACGQFAAAVSAVKTIAKIHGLLLTRAEVGKPGDFAPMESLTDEQLIAIATGRSADAVAASSGATVSNGVH